MEWLWTNCTTIKFLLKTYCWNEKGVGFKKITLVSDQGRFIINGIVSYKFSKKVPTILIIKSMIQ